MKTKGIPVWERFIEHIVLLVAVLLFIAFTASQFVGSPNEVTKGRYTLRPDNVDQVLRERAEELQTRLAPDAPPPLEFAAEQSDDEDFVARLEAPIRPEAELAMLMPRYTLHVGAATIPSGRRYVEPEVAAPYMVAAQQYYDGLAPEVVANHQVLNELLEKPPYDISWITPVAYFSLAGVLEQFQREDPEAGIYAIPASWYRSRPIILDLKIERQELVDGQWTEPALLAPFPGQETIRKELAEKVDATMRDRLLDRIAAPATQERLVRPAFFGTLNQSWIPLDPKVEVVIEQAAGEGNEQVVRIRRDLNQHRADAQRLRTWIEENCAGVSAPTGGGAPDGGEGGGRGEGGAGGGRGAPGGGISGGVGGGGKSRTSGGNQRTEADAARCRRQQETLERTEERVKRLQEELRQLVGEDAVVPQDQPATDQVMQSDELLVWGHDLNIDFGRTYRYRFTVELYNPFFAQKIQLIEEQQGLADPVVLRSATSEWSSPIEARPPLRYFVTDARPPSARAAGRAASLGTATLELYRFYDGRWWQLEERFGPGEWVAGTIRRPGAAEEGAAGPTEIDFGTTWYILDIVSVPDRSAGDRFAAEVLLQNVQTNELTRYYDPLNQSEEAELLRLRSEVALLEGDLAVRK